MVQKCVCVTYLGMRRRAFLNICSHIDHGVSAVRCVSEVRSMVDIWCTTTLTLYGRLTAVVYTDDGDAV